MVTVDSEPYEFEGKMHWRVIARSDLENLIAIPNMGNIVPILGKDAANRMQVAYVLYDQDVWTREELESNELLGEMLSQCKICSSLNSLQDASAGDVSDPKSPLPAVRHEVSIGPSYTPLKFAPGDSRGNGPYPMESQGQFSRRVTMGDMVAPPAISSAIKVGQSLFCTTMGKTISSGIAALFFDWLGGRSSDEGLRSTFLSLADDFIRDFDIGEQDKALAMADLRRAYELWKKDKPGAIKVGLFQNPIEVAAQVFKTTDTSDPKRTTTTVGFKGQAFRSNAPDIVR